MSKYLTEILDEVNKDPATLAKYRENLALKFLFQHAFIPEQKFELPEGDPPFKPDSAPLGMSPANLIMETKKLYVFTKAKEIKKVRKEQLFIQLLENVHPSEAKLLLAIKDQKLNKLYKNITADLVADYGFIPRQIKSAKTPKKSQG
jgi:hypothetical protein